MVIYLKRETYKPKPLFGRSNPPDYYLRSSPKKPWKWMNVLAKDIWEGLELPEEDGEYELAVILGDRSAPN